MDVGKVKVRVGAEIARLEHHEHVPGFGNANVAQAGKAYCGQARRGASRAAAAWQRQQAKHSHTHMSLFWGRTGDEFYLCARVPIPKRACLKPDRHRLRLHRLHNTGSGLAAVWRAGIRRHQNSLTLARLMPHRRPTVSMGGAREGSPGVDRAGRPRRPPDLRGATRWQVRVVRLRKTSDPPGVGHTRATNAPIILGA